MLLYASRASNEITNMSGDFENKVVVVVTGGSRGIRRATALQLAAGEADVAISYCSRVEPAG